jgi:hypothetical protein
MASNLGRKPTSAFFRGQVAVSRRSNAVLALVGLLREETGNGERTGAMTISLSAILPNLSNGIENTGFLFGAGTSVEAGYPMMASLTRSVVDGLTTTERATFEEALHSAASTYDHAAGEPNIEVIADIVLAHAINSGDPRFSILEGRIRDLVTEAILGVSSPRLDHHIRFLELLKARTYGRAACVYIFTTNYDVLFELAGAEAGVVVESGFIGSVERYFDPLRFTTACGAMQANARFSEHPVLTVRLVKLHGSVSWYSRNGRIFERHPESISAGEKRVMVLPRRGKVMDTLQSPYDTLFRTMSQSLGADCKYMASCGFSFGDDHINANLIQPAISGGKIRLFALAAAETGGMSGFKSAPAFGAGFDTSGITGGVAHTNGCDLWKFSRFVELFA